MKTAFRQQDNAMIKRLFFRLLPVQVLVIAMEYINSLVDGVAAARFIGAEAVAVIGLYYTVLRVLEAVGAVLIGGVTVLSGRYLGSNRIDKASGICSLSMGIALLVGAVLTVFSFAVPYQIAGLLGADELLTEQMADYIKGYAFGIIPQMLAQQVAITLQLERKDKLGQAGIAVMIIVNALLDVLFVGVWHMDTWGLALATSVANWAYLLVIIQHYFSRSAQLKPRFSLIDFPMTLPLLKIGFPNVLLVACLAARSLTINRILISSSAGSDGVSALSSFNMLCGLIICVALGTGSLIRMLTSIFLGEDNREGLLIIIRIALTRVMAIMIAIGAALILTAPVLAGIFYPDSSSRVYEMSRELFFIYGFCTPLTLMCIVFSSYYQAAGHHLFVNLISLMDGFFSMVIPAMLLSPVLGATGVWLAFPIGLVITLAVTLLYPVIRLRHIPRSLDEWLLIPTEFGTADGMVLYLHDLQDVVRTAEKVEAFCDGHGVGSRTSMYAGVCLEEMAGNIVHHGFHMDRKSHMIEVRVGVRYDGVLLRIKDDCIPFNPEEWYEMTSSSAEDTTSNMGIRIVHGMAEEVSYQNLLGLNVLTILLKD